MTHTALPTAHTTPTSQPARVLSGMRPTGWLHLGHYHGVLENWIKLQHTHDCYFFAADWHALTTHYDNPRELAQHTKDMVIDWLAAGIDPDKATIFVQSDMPEHAELHVLLSMGTPLSWLERIPTYKDQQEKLKEKDLATYGFLGYPLLQSADILLYRATQIPVGADQVSHIELTREVARRFNFLYGRDPLAAEKYATALHKAGKKPSKTYLELQKRYQETGDASAYDEALVWLEQQSTLSLDDKAWLMAGIKGLDTLCRSILPEPEALLTEASKMPGLDGQKMSKSYGNTISLRERPDDVIQKIKRMPTDPARVRRTDCGDPQKCPVWQLHVIYSQPDTQAWVQQGCTSASIGCIECKQPVAESINHMLIPMRERAMHFEQDEQLLQRVLTRGAEKARATARETLHEVRSAMGLIGRWSA